MYTHTLRYTNKCSGYVQCKSSIDHLIHKENLEALEKMSNDLDRSAKDMQLTSQIPLNLFGVFKQVLCRISLFFLCTLGVSINMTAQVEVRQWLNFQQYGPEEGLDGNELADIVVDSTNTYWVSDSEAIHSFQGQQLERLPIEKFGLPTDSCFRIFNDRLGMIWIVYFNSLSNSVRQPYQEVSGVHIFNPYNQELTSLAQAHINLPFTLSTIHLLWEAGGDIFISTKAGGLHKWDGIQWKTLAVTIPGNPLISWACATEEEELLIVAGSSLWRQKGANLSNVATLNTAYQRGVLENGTLLLHQSTHVAPLKEAFTHTFLYNVASGQSLQFWQLLSGDKAHILTLDKQGQLWYHDYTNLTNSSF